MPKKKTTATMNNAPKTSPEIEVRLIERRSPVPYNSFEAGCIVRAPISDIEKSSTDMDQLIEVAEDGLDRIRALLEDRLKQDVEDGVV